MVRDIWENKPDTFVPVYYQMNAGTATQPWCWTRLYFFDNLFTPNLWLNGSDDRQDWYWNWANDVANAAQTATDVTIAVRTFRGGDRLDVRATVCIEAAGVGKDLRIYFVQVLDHFPATQDYYRNAFRQVMTQDVTIAAGTCVDLQKVMSVKAEDLVAPSNIGVVVWAQEPLAAAPAEIYQGGYAMDTDGIFADGFEGADTSVWN